MENNLTNKELIINLLFSNSPEEENNSGYYTFEPKTYQQIFQSLIPLIKANDTELIIDLRKHTQAIDFQSFNKSEMTEEYRYIRQGGGDLYTYIKLKVEPIAEPVLVVKEELPMILGELIDGNRPKNECVEWMTVYPYILKALVDDCLRHKMIGLKFTLLLVKFHPVDFRPFAYYVCARRLLNQMWGNN
jgi:hypothetical protein